MTTTDALHILFGAALVAIGVLVTALADRIRNLRAARETAPRERAGRAQHAHAHAPAPASVIPVVTPADLFRPAPAAKQPRPPRAESRVAAASTEGGEDVITALVAAGYKKPVATDATWACSAAERATVESWTASALRRCARGGMS